MQPDEATTLKVYLRTRTDNFSVLFLNGDWIALCRECGAQNILAVTGINKALVLMSLLRVIGLRV